MMKDYDTSALMERMRDCEEALSRRIKGGKEECPRKKIIKEIKQALDLCQIMIKAKCVDDGQHDSDHESQIAIVVVENDPELKVHSVKMPLIEVGVDQVCFISKNAPLGKALLTNKASLKKGGGFLFSHETKRDGQINIMWEISSFYESEEAKKIILQNIHSII